jgi:plastocyanin
MSTRVSRRGVGLAAAVWGCALMAGVWAGIGYTQQVAAAGPTEIGINNFTFVPGAVNVPVGTTVTWVNHDEEPHTIVNRGATRLFKSAALDTDDKFSFKFEQPGTYEYFCSVHPNMQGTIVVQ